MKPFSLLLSTLFWYQYTIVLSHALLLGNETDHLALLNFKQSISSDPFGILDSWNDASNNHFCNWPGITCNKQQRVIALRLPGYHLHGPLSPQLSNLSFLSYIDLENNTFYGHIPQEFGLLKRLQVLYLNNNSLTGEFPINLTSCSQLSHFDFSWNNLIGNIPIQIGSLSNLKEFFIESNNFSGSIPPSIGNLTSLTALVLIYNNLEGNIPQELCSLKNLTYLLLDSNKFSGTLPSCLYKNMSSLSVLSIAYNNINGSLPANMFHNLPNLQFFQIGTNSLSGTIPVSVANASSIYVLDFTRNKFVGQVPSLGKLTKLRFLSVSENNLGGVPTKDLKFLNSLTNCSNLYMLGISVNNFGGRLPNYIGNLSTHLSNLYLGYNQIFGKIPAELGNLVNLTLLTMSHCRFDGNIPATFGQFQKIGVLELNENKLSGEIPAFIGNLSQLYFLNLADNMFEGSIPSSIGNSQSLQHLNFSMNNLTGTIPSEIFSISSLTTLLDLSQNSFSGNLSDEVGNLENLNVLKLSDNNLVGNIPTSIAKCLSLEFLYLQGNSFSGTISSSLVSLKGLRELDISRNHFSGSIPEGLQNISLVYLNISFNMLDGQVPTGGVFRNVSEFAMIGNNELCGGVSELHLPPCPSEAKKLKRHHNFRLIAVIVCVFAFFFILSLFLTIYWMRKRSRKMFSHDSHSPEIDQLAKVSYQSLHNGTNGFSEENLIGSGSFGSVYKGTLELEGSVVVVAIKVLKLQTKGAEKSFVAECNALRNVRHRNLVKILTCCSGTDYKGQEFKALVFEFMRNGSLESWLHPPSTGIANHTLNLEQRLNIINDVASAFHYLHYECDSTIIHCDLKPSNVVLDDFMVAHVADFGLARLVGKNIIGECSMQTSSIGLEGTFGYASPEYGMGYQVCMEGDIYSFGILILEMVTGKRPTDEMFKDGYNLHNYVQVSISSNILQIVDPRMLYRKKEVHPSVDDCLISLLRIGLACSMESPNERMDMVDVMRELNRIRSCFTSAELKEEAD